jgi:hypothetical protein
MSTDKIEQQDPSTWLHSLDREVTTLGRSHASMRATQEAQALHMERIEQGIDKLLDAQAKPKPPIQLISAIGGIATIVVALAVFLELRLKPSEEITGLMYNQQAALTAMVGSNNVTAAQAISTGVAERAGMSFYLRQLDDRLQRMDSRIRETENAN